MDFSRILNKPFLVGRFDWVTGDSRGAIVGSMLFPRVMLSNYLANVPFRSSTLYRMRACVILQVSGTPMHQGLLLAAAIPPGLQPEDPTQLLQAPHSFLNANESTPVCIEIPFYSRCPLAKTNENENQVAHADFDYAEIKIMVVTPLATGLTGSMTLSVSAHIVVKDADFYVPRTSDVAWAREGLCISKKNIRGKVSNKSVCEIDCGRKESSYSSEGFLGDLARIPTNIFDGLARGAKMVTGDFIDSLRVGIRTLTGFHNPNTPAINSRIISTTRNFTNAVDQPTLIEKMDQHAQFDRIVQDYQFNTAQDEMDVGYILSKPVYEDYFKVSTGTAADALLFSRPITPFVETSKNAKFYSPMRLLYENSRYWRGGLKMHIQAVMTNFHYCKLVVVRDYSSDHRLLTNYPPLSDMHNLMTETIEFSAGGQIVTIDLPYCSSLEQLECTKYLDLNALSHGMVYVYLLQPLTTNGSVANGVYFNVYFSGGSDLQFYGYSVDPISVNRLAVPSFLAEGGEVTVGISDQAALESSSQEYPPDSVWRVDDFKPMINMRDYFRRVVPLQVTTITNTEGGVNTFSIAKLLHGQVPLLAFRSMFYGFTGGIKFKFLVQGTNVGQLVYVPPGMCLSSTYKVIPTTPSASWTIGQSQSMDFTVNRVPYSSPFIESPSNQSNMSAPIPTSVISFECVVPNMNPYRFIGGSSSYTSSYDTVGESMGHLVLLTPQSLFPSFPLQVQIYMGFTDETRFGFQVYTPEYEVKPINGEESVRNSLFALDNTTSASIFNTAYPTAYFSRDL